MSDQHQEEESIKVARRVYVGNLAWKTTWQDLKDHFSAVGEVRFADVLRDGGMRSKGCGIVEFENAESAKIAIETLNHSMLDGRQVFVREDREDFELKGHEGPSGRKAYGEVDQVLAGRPTAGVVLGKKVWVGNLAGDVTWKDLKDHFRGAGNVVHAAVLEHEDGTSKGCGIVEFASPSEALRAISMLSNSMLRGNAIVVREDREEAYTVAPRSQRLDDGYQQQGAESNQVVIHGLPYKMAWQDLKDMVREFARGPVIRADIVTTVTGLSKGYGVVVLSSPEDAQSVISNLHGRVVEGRVLTAKFDKFSKK